MKNKIKSLLIIFVAVIICSTPLIFTGCGNGNENSQPQYKELTMDNYNYYLSIDKTLTDSGSALQGSIRYSSYKVTINGAVSGLFEDCSLYYKIGDGNKIEVKLNAAGFASFNYTQTNSSGNFQFCDAKGKIYI